MHIHIKWKTQISETYTIMSSKCQIDIINNNNIQHSLANIMPIFTTWPVNTLDDKVNKLPITNLMEVC